MNELITTDLETGDPFVVWCRKCNKHVDSFEINTPVMEIPDDNLPGLMKKINTGEIITIIKCHGESWRASFSIWAEKKDD